MSVWTHINGSIRIDSIHFLDNLNKADIAKILGKIVTWEDLMEDTSEIATELPMGSEGSLQYTIWENPDSSDITRFTVNIWGDLRDYRDLDAIKKWFEKVLNSGFMIRSAVLEVEVEYLEHVILVAHEADSKFKLKCFKVKGAKK